MNWKRLIATGFVAGAVALTSAGSAFATDGGSGSGRRGASDDGSSASVRSASSVRSAASVSVVTFGERNDDDDNDDDGRRGRGRGGDDSRKDDDDDRSITTMSTSSTTGSSSSTFNRVRGFSCVRANEHVASIAANLARLEAVSGKLQVLADAATAAGDADLAAEIQNRIDHIARKIAKLTDRLDSVNRRIVANC